MLSHRKRELRFRTHYIREPSIRASFSSFQIFTRPLHRIQALCSHVESMHTLLGSRGFDKMPQCCGRENYSLTEAINEDGDRKSWDARGPMIWDNFSIFRTNCAILTSYICANPRMCRGFSRGCCHVAGSNAESC